MIYPILAQTMLIIQTTEGTKPVGTPLWLPIFLVILMALLFWWGMSRNSIPTGTATPDTHVHHDSPHDAHAHEMHTSEAVVETAVVADKPNDLKTIEGIGPKIESILHAAGILTFTQLANASVSQLERIVKHDAGITIASPDTWPEQATLARDEQWEQLDALQDELKGGRRT
ncbi:MAG: hypothetical protein GY943_17930 [Chloroflexi bacterium]|nr:hypothetical protein [Chloroflexota bacterium]